MTLSPGSLDAHALHVMLAIAVFLLVCIAAGIGASVYFARQRLREQAKLKAIEEARRRRRARRQQMEKERQAALAAAGRERGGRRARRRPVVMVVDDSPTVLLAARKALESESYRVITAENGREAWNVLQDQRPDLIVSDIEMPNINGFQLLKLVREDLELAEMPVMLMTSHLYYDVKMGQSAGANAFLAKPYEAKDLLEQVRYLLPE